MAVPQAPGKYVCTNAGCSVAGYRTPRTECLMCHRPTQVAGTPGMVIPTPRPQAARPAGGFEVLSRAIFGGFWLMVTVGLVIFGITLLISGYAIGLLAFLAAIPTGLYSRYIFRGGRFRIIFW